MAPAACSTARSAMRRPSSSIRKCGRSCAAASSGQRADQTRCLPMLDAAALARNPLASRADARRLLTDMFEPLVPCFSEGRAQVRIAPDAAHFDRKAAWFEGFARPLWGLGPLAAGGGAFAHWQLFRDGIASG